jgi:selenocysteine-specific translation elongation factor
MAQKEIGKVNHWYDKAQVAVVKLSGSVKVGDKIKVKKGDSEFEETVGSMQVNHAAVSSGKKGDEVAIQLSKKTKEGAVIYSAE